LNRLELEKALYDGLRSQGFSDDAVSPASNAVMPLLEGAKEVVARSIAIEVGSTGHDELISEVSEKLSTEFQQYQAGVGSFVLRLLVQLAIERARCFEIQQS